MPRTYTRIPLEQRFFEKIDKTNTCWIWKGTIGSHGYGMFFIEKTPKLIFKVAHRVSWEIKYGEIPNGLFVLHKCDNRKCVNPDHLFLGTQLNNVHDCMSKGRHSFGDKNGRRKLSEKDVLEIRKLNTGKRGDAAKIASKFGVSRRNIARILNGTTWKHSL